MGWCGLDASGSG